MKNALWYGCRRTILVPSVVVSCPQMISVMNRNDAGRRERMGVVTLLVLAVQLNGVDIMGSIYVVLN